LLATSFGLGFGGLDRGDCAALLGALPPTLFAGLV
jgi:hypothetical protein